MAGRTCVGGALLRLAGAGLSVCRLPLAQLRGRPGLGPAPQRPARQRAQAACVSPFNHPAE